MRTRYVLLFVAVLTAGCDKLTTAISDRKTALQDREGIQAYSESVKRTEKKRHQWMTTVQETNQLTTPKTVRSAVLSNVVPALKDYMNAVESMPVNVDELRPIHKAMVKVLKELLVHYRDFADELKHTNYAEKRKQLQSALAEFTAAQQQYRNQVQSLYESMGVELEIPRIGQHSQN